MQGAYTCCAFSISLVYLSRVFSSRLGSSTREKHIAPTIGGMPEGGLQNVKQNTTRNQCNYHSQTIQISIRYLRTPQQLNFVILTNDISEAQKGTWADYIRRSVKPDKEVRCDWTGAIVVCGQQSSERPTKLNRIMESTYCFPAAAQSLSDDGEDAVCALECSMPYRRILSNARLAPFLSAAPAGFIGCHEVDDVL